jgi:putative ABC transport system permease protein
MGAKTKWGVIDVQGVDANTQIYRKQLTAGRWFTPGEHDVLLLSDDTLRQTGLTIGDTLTFTDVNDNSAGHGANWKIIGSVNDAGRGLGASGTAVTSIENVNLFAGTQEDSASQLYIQARDRSSAAVSQLVQQLDKMLNQRDSTATVLSAQQEIQKEQLSALGLYIVFYVAAAGVALAGVLGLYNTLMSSVLERQREIGIWRSMGASNWQVSLVFWIEGLSLASLAWLVGALIGVPAAYGFDLLVSQWLFPVPFAFDPWSLPLMLLALIVIATLACFGPTARASRARIAEILRYG